MGIVYGSEKLKKTAVCDWFGGLKNGEELVENGERSIVKNDESVEEVQNSVRLDCRLRVRGSV